MCNIDSVQSIKDEVMAIINLVNEDKEFPDNFHVEVDTDFMVYKYFDDYEDKLNYCVSYYEGEFILLEYNINWDYCEKLNKQPGIFLE